MQPTTGAGQQGVPDQQRLDQQAQKISELDRSQRKEERSRSDQTDWFKCKDMIVVIKISTT
jgi:hypothetical protein